MRRLSLILLILSLGLGLVSAGPSLAAAKLRTLPPAPKAEPAAPVVKPAQSRPQSLTGQLAPLPSFAGAPGLAALGLDRMRLGAADAGPACRQTCAAARYVCGVDDASCVSDWRQCVLSCGTSRP